jgi:hypothetical protein
MFTEGRGEMAAFVFRLVFCSITGVVAFWPLVYFTGWDAREFLPFYAAGMFTGFLLAEIARFFLAPIIRI